MHILIARNTKWRTRYIELPPRGEADRQSQCTAGRAVGRSMVKRNASVFLYVTHTKTTTLLRRRCGVSTRHAALHHQPGGLPLPRFWHCLPGGGIRLHRLRVGPAGMTPPQMPIANLGCHCASDQQAPDQRFPRTPLGSISLLEGTAWAKPGS